jgi:hypothetical protein
METRESHRTSTRLGARTWGAAAVMALAVSGVRAAATAGARLAAVDAAPVATDRRTRQRSHRGGASALVRGAPAPRSWAQGFDKPLA